ncbi:MAG: Asp-tRNA(Asn)/Glu-tRNA(Gln) amidotransferase subunit GatB [Bacilli bacterium]
MIKTIGIEVHLALKTKEKAFSNSVNANLDVPNSNFNLIDFGYPGTLPLINKEIIDSGLKMALALNCKINKEMHFDRKNYFYADLPKGYQITQNKTPIGYDGYVEIYVDGQLKKIDIERIHIEEDTAKSIHNVNSTYLDYNRCGTPLLEIVTKAVIKDEKEAVAYLETLKNIALFLNISDCKIEEGSMRCDTNISLRKNEDDPLGNKVEIKNIGSFSEVALSIIFEEKRQRELIESGKIVEVETRRISGKETLPMRKKEKGNEYKYHEEPDVPKIILSDEKISTMKDEVKLLPINLHKKYKDFGLNDIIIGALMSNIQLLKFYEKVLETKADYLKSANVLCNNVLSYLNEKKLLISETNLKVEDFSKLINKLTDNKINNNMAKDIILKLIKEPKTIEEILNCDEYKILDESEIVSIIEKIIEENPSSVEDHKNGLSKAMKFLMGQVMKQTKGKVDAKRANELLFNCLSKY